LIKLNLIYGGIMRNVLNYENAMVGLFDILGFKNILFSIPLKEVVDVHYGYLREALYFGIFAEEPKHDPTWEEIRDQNKLGVAWFSDSVLIYSLRDNEDNYCDLIRASAYMLMKTICCSYPPIRFRIGISYGEVFIDPEKQIYLGKPIIQAYKLQEKQQWSGGILDKFAKAKIPQYVKDQNYPFPWFLIPYKVPLKLNEKNGFSVVNNDMNSLKIPITGCTTMLAIDWTRFLHGSFTLNWSKEKAEPDPGEAPYDVIFKWKMTKEFHETVCQFCKKQK
jgi:hypothetical protein